MNTLTINMNTLDKTSQKELRKAFYTFKGKGTVRQIRSMLRTGKIGTVVFSVLVFGLFLMLGAVFLPLAIIAPFAALAVPFKVRKDNEKWDTLLPADRADDVVVIE